jgi:GNAT superfamily N-acetyltransferase
MMSALLLESPLARRVELAEAQAAVETAGALEASLPGSGAAVEAVAGGFAVYCGANSPLTQAVGLGLHGSVSEEEFSRLENFYQTRNEPVRVETCPLADASLIEHYGKRNYRVTEFTNVMARPMNRNGAEHWPVPARGVSIETAEPGHMDLWTQTVAQGFAESYPVTPELLQVMKMFAMRPSSTCYLARVDGKVAGGATLALHDGIAGLFGASTLPAFRGRGVQSALLHARLARAQENGSDLAVCLAQPGSVSQRNVVRQGFQVLYTRVKFENDFDASKNQ